MSEANNVQNDTRVQSQSLRLQIYLAFSGASTSHLSLHHIRFSLSPVLWGEGRGTQGGDCPKVNPLYFAAAFTRRSSVLFVSSNWCLR